MARDSASFVSRARAASAAVACLAMTGITSAGCAPAPGVEAEPLADAPALRLRAERLLERGELGEALDVAASAAKLAPGDAESWLLLGSLHAMAGHAPQERTSYAACVTRATQGLIEQCRTRLE